MKYDSFEKIDYCENTIERIMYDGFTMLQLLLVNRPSILDLNEQWVDKLLKAEKNYKGKDNMTCLMCLF